MIELPTVFAVLLALAVLVLGVSAGVVGTLLWAVRLVAVPIRSRRDET